METMLTAYPDFVPNQVLTSTQLNDLRRYLDQQNRVSRVRLVGTGIACGLRVAAGTGTVTVGAGFGVTSAGDLVELPATTYDHYREWTNADELDRPEFRPGKDGAARPDVVELLDSNTFADFKAPPNVSPLTVATLKKYADRVVALFVGRTSVDLDSCLVTDCDNEGKNVVIAPRVLLAGRGALDEIESCPHGAASPIIDIPRLHSEYRLTDIVTADQLDAAYGRLVDGSVTPFAAAVGDAFDRYDPYLDIGSDADPAALVESAIGAFLEAGSGRQYAYDLIWDLNTAYEEMTAAACELVGECEPARDHPDHLLLGTLDGTDGYRHGWDASPVRDVADGERVRVRDLFRRLLAMAEASTPDLLDDLESVRLVPSQTARSPLGHRAIPFYYDRTEQLVRLWHPDSCCTARAAEGIVNRYESPFDSRYAEHSLIRIEGHVGLDRAVVAETIAVLRAAHNVEFDLIELRVDAAATDSTAVESAVETLKDIASTWKGLRADVGKVWVGERTWSAGVEIVAGALDAVREREVEDPLDDWRDARCGRPPLCDVSALEADYLVARAEVLSVLTALDGLAAHIPEYDGLADLSSSTDLLENITVLETSFAENIPIAGNLLEFHDVRNDLRDVRHTQLAAAKPEWSSLFLGWTRLRSAAGGLRRELPKELCAFHRATFAQRFDEVAAELAAVAVLAANVHDPEATGGAELVPVDDVAAVTADAMSSLRHLRGVFDALSIAYEVHREAGEAVLSRVAARTPGLEHLGGVEPGGTFVVVAGTDGAVVADFSLAGRLPCCCGVGVDEMCIPPAAGVVVASGVVRRGKGENYWMEPVDIDLSAATRDPNDPAGSVELSLLDTSTELGGDVQLEKAVARYSNGAPVPGALDRFRYSLDGECGTDDGWVLVYLVPPPEPEVTTGTIAGHVTIDGELPGAAVARLSGRPEVAEVDDQGEFGFDDVDAGTHTVTLETKEWGAPAQEQVEVRAGLESQVHFALSLSTVEVTAVNERNGPESGVRVQMESLPSGSRSFLGTTDGNGELTFESVVPGSYRIRADGATEQHEFTLYFDQTETIHFVVPRAPTTGTITGQVTFNEKVVNLEEIGFTAVAKASDRADVTDVEPEDGSFEFHDVTIGKQVLVRVDVPELDDSQEKNVVVSDAGGSVTVVFDFELATIEVVAHIPEYVATEEWEPLIEFIGEQPPPLWAAGPRTPTFSTGSGQGEDEVFTFAGLPPGRYRILGGAEEEEIEVLSGGAEEVEITYEDLRDGPEPPDPPEPPGY